MSTQATAHTELSLPAIRARAVLLVLARAFVLAVAVYCLARVRTESEIWVHAGLLAVSLACVYVALGKGFRVWAFYIVGFVAFAQLRSYADEIGTPVQYEYAIAAERALFLGTLPNNWLQDWFYEYRELRVLEAYTMFVYLSYFFTPHILALVLWKWDFARFKPYVIAFLITLYAGVVTSALLPTAPPWLAGQEGHIPHVYQIVQDIAGEVTPGTYQQAYEVAGSNPVAAMPSLHAAVPFLMMFALWKYPIARWVGASYAVSMSFAIVYLGEHYFVDALAGLAFAAVAWVVARRAVEWWDDRRAVEGAENASEGRPTPAESSTA